MKYNSKIKTNRTYSAVDADH